ncbi:sulfatase family protein [Neolewinella aquimaris]|uniref:sulfatase family protein n=1 Tax=Neolewinella aquimaris TaxID=1835722 RepID=UPI0038732069
MVILCLVILSACGNRDSPGTAAENHPRPNVLVLLTDQWRAQATGYAGDPNVSTPNLDALAASSVNFENAVSGMPVCSPFRASLLTGQRPLTHGVFMNDVQLDTAAVTIGEVFGEAGYQMGYIGKWHLDGHGRLQNVAPGQRRQGFDFWMGNECTHNYNHSVYYDNEDPTRKIWDGYDSFGQTDAALDYITDRQSSPQPFMLIVSYGTPHAPYHTAPEAYRQRFDPGEIELRENVPEHLHEQVRKDLAGYYAHIAALDDMMGRVMDTLKQTGQWKNTIVLFTSDHGDLLGSHGAYKKQQPYDESIRVPMLFRIPSELGLDIPAGKRQAVINSEDIMPTLLGLCDIPVPAPVEGVNYRAYLEGADGDGIGASAVITCVQPFGQWNRLMHGGREYRGLRTQRYTYTRDLDGPWLLFDNEQDPYQMTNLVDDAEHTALRKELDSLLQDRLTAQGDEFRPGMDYIAEWGYPVNETGTVPYTH